MRLVVSRPVFGLLTRVCKHKVVPSWWLLRRNQFGVRGHVAAEINSKHQPPSSRKVPNFKYAGRARHSVRAVRLQSKPGAHGVTRPTRSVWCLGLDVSLEVGLELGVFILLCRRISEAFALDIVGGDERAGETSDTNFGKIHVRHVRN